MSGFTKTCIYCNKEIRLSNDTGRWLPYNSDGNLHECKTKDKEKPLTQVKQETTRRK